QVKTEPEQEYILIPICITDPLISQGPQDGEEDAGVKPTEVYESEASDKMGRMNKTQEEHKKVIQALEDPSWIEAMQEELLQFKLQKVWTLVDLPNGKRAIGTKWVLRNKKDERGIVVRNKARLVAQGYTQEEGIDYDEVFAPVARIEAIRLFLAYASYIGFIMYHMDVKSALLYGTIEKEVYVCQPPGFEDPHFPDKVYKMMHNRFQMSSTRELTFFLGLQVQQKEDVIFISQDKYVADILKTFNYVTLKTTSTPIEPNKALVKDEEADNVEVHLYRSLIGSLMYLTASRPDITFAVYACARFQVTPKTSHLHAVKRIFRYLKGQPKLGLWYPRDSPFDLEAFSDSDYAGAIANSTTEAEYVATANCCGQVLWIQNKMLDYGFNFMNTKIYIDNESTICIVNNPKFHAKTKNIEIRHHFIRDSYEKKLNLLLPVLVYAARHSLTTVRHKLMLLGITSYCWQEPITISTPKFAETHNLVVFLEKPQESTGFEEIIDFLNASSVQYALSVNPTIYTPCIRSDLKLDDAEGIDCLPTATIFAELERMGGFSRRVTPLFSTMMVQATEDMGEDLAAPSDSHSTPIISIISHPNFKMKKSKIKRGNFSGPTGASFKRKEDASKQGRKIVDLDADAEVTLVDETLKMNDDNLCLIIGVWECEEKDIAEKEVSVADPVTTAGEVVTTANVEVTTANAPTTTIDELTLAQTLIEIKAAKPKAVTSAATTTTTTRPKARGVAKMVEPEKPLKKKDQIAMDEEVARNLEAQLQAELEEEERISRLKEEKTNIDLLES
ncbi:putative ribonuclease H-like domain-containing protein, partial [Tanacetum coccineum]